MRRAQGVAVLAAALVLVLCTGCTMTRRYTQATGTFPGIKSFHEKPSTRVSLLFIHGMGSFSKPQADGEEDPAPTIEYVARELHLRKGTPERHDLTPAWRGYVVHTPLLGADGTVAMDAYALHWKPTTRALTDALTEADERPPLDRMRPEGTAKVKAAMNDRLGDVALYAGPYQKTIQDTVIKGLLAVERGATVEPGEKHVIIPVTWSLGSRVLFDTLGRMHQSHSAELNRLASRIPLVFMLANQIQFLELTKQPHVEPTADGSEPPPVPQRVVVRDLVAPLTTARAEQNKTTWIVGVTDPSDLLSWPLPSGDSDANVRLVNAYHSAASTGVWIPGTGKLGNPYSAHTDYGADTQVLTWMVYGSDGATFCNPPPKRGY